MTLCVKQSDGMEVYMEKSTKEEITNKEKNKTILKYILIIIFLVIIIGLIYFLTVIKQNSTNIETEINYNLLNVEKDNGNIIMQNETNAEVKDGVKRNISNNIKKERKYNDIVIKEATIEASGGMSQFIAIIKNSLNKDVQGELVQVIFVNQSNSEITRIETYFPNLAKGETSTLNISTDIDLTNAYDYYIQKIK